VFKLINFKGKTRTLIQLLFFIVIVVAVIRHSLFETASLHALCPFGGVVSVYQYLTTGTFVKKIHESSFILMIIIGSLSILLGPVFCGWVCPLGSIQEWIGNIGKKIFKLKYNTFIPYKAHKYLRFLRYIVLAIVVYMTAIYGELLFQNIGPYYALFNMWSGEATTASIVLLGFILVGSLFVERPWCKYLCPLGALIGISNRISIFKISRDNTKCVSCKICDDVCPMNIKVSDTDYVKSSQCIRCMKCTSEFHCPVKDTVELSTSFKKEVVKHEN